MFFEIIYNEPVVKEGYEIANEVLASWDLVERIEDLSRLTYTKKTPKDLAADLRYWQFKARDKDYQLIPIKDYFEKNRNVIATTFTGTRGIFVNSNQVRARSVKNFISNGAHEFGHIPLGYSHGTNFPPGSWRGRMLGDWEDKSLSACHTLERLVLGLAIEKRLVRA